MMRFRSAVVLALTIAVLGAALWLSRRQTGFTTLEQCLDAHAEASRSGDVDAYLASLSDPLRQRMLEKYPESVRLGEALRQSTRDVKSRVQIGDPEIEGDQAKVFVDEVRPSGTSRVCYHLERGERGWHITGIEAPESVPTLVPFGTHIKDAP